MNREDIIARWNGMSSPQRNKWVAESVMKYHIYHYDKDVERGCS